MEKTNPQRLLFAVDPSLTASGWALFHVQSQRPLAVGILAALGPAFSMSERLQRLQSDIEEIFNEVALSQKDVLICEGPAPLVLNPNSAMKVEQVRGVFEAVARMRQVSVPGRLNPRTVQSEILGMRGKQRSRAEVKDWARATVDKLFGNEIMDLPCYGVRRRAAKLPQDIIDALLIGVLAVSRVRRSSSMNVSLESMFESRKQTGSRPGGRGMSSWRDVDIAKLQS